jgi:hypothetical protein
VHEQLQLLDPPVIEGGLTPLGIPGFAGFFLSLLEEDGWAVSITHAFAGTAGELLIVAAREDEHVQRAAPAAVAAVEVFKRARDLDADRRGVRHGDHLEHGCVNGAGTE